MEAEGAKEQTQSMDRDILPVLYVFDLCVNSRGHTHLQSSKIVAWLVHSTVRRDS